MQVFVNVLVYVIASNHDTDEVETEESEIKETIAEHSSTWRH